MTLKAEHFSHLEIAILAEMLKLLTLLIVNNKKLQYFCINMWKLLYMEEGTRVRLKGKVVREQTKSGDTMMITFLWFPSKSKCHG